MVISGEAERIFEKLAEMYGKRTVPFESIKGRTTVPEEYIGAWVLLEGSDGRLSIAEIKGTSVTLANLRFPLGAIAFKPIDFPSAVDMAMHAVREYMYVYPTLPGVRHEIPPGEIYGAHLPQVTIDGTTYYRDDVKKEFRVVGHPGQHISFKDYEQKYFGGERWLRAYFSGNVAKIESGRGEIYETTNQDNALQAIDYWVLNGVLKQGACPEREPKRPGRGVGNELMVEKVQMEITIRATPHYTMQTGDAPKALRAIRSWLRY